MFDDGSHGDKSARDNIFTTQTSLTEFGAGPVFLRVSVAYKGILKRKLSPPLPLIVAIEDNAEAARSAFAERLQAGDKSGAYERLGDRLVGDRALDDVEASFLAELAHAATTCTVTDSRDYLQVCVSSRSGGLPPFRFILVREATGTWRIVGW